MHYGIQLFGAKALFRQNPRAFLEKTAAMGYEFIEPGVQVGPFSGMPQAHRDGLWKPEEYPQFMAQMRELGLRSVSCHVFADDLPGAVPAMLRIRDQVGVSAFVVNPGGSTQAECEARAGAFNQVALALKQEGAQLLLHNSGDSSYEKTADGRSLYEEVLRLCPDMGAQLDTGWALWGGEDPLTVAIRLGPRMKSLHIKEMARGFAGRQGVDRFAVLGEGVTQLPPLLKLAGEAMPVIVDQDVAFRGFFDDFERTMAALRAAEAQID